jgi:NitT/TauT family transport system permease protein
MPQSLVETAVIYRFSPWQRITRLELPFAAIGLIWNSVMSMAGGWFFLMINESFVLGDKDFRLPGLGSYMSVAVAEGNVPAMLWAIVAMVLMIVALDQLLWRPLVVWGQKFRVEEGNEEQTMRSWFLDFLRRSQLVRGLARALRPTPSAPKPVAPAVVRPSPGGGAGTRVLMAVLLGVLVLLILLGSWRLFLLFSRVTGAQWADLAARSLATLGRVMAATLLGLAWTLPVGLKIGLSPRLSRIFQPVLQVMAAFPAPMLFPAVVLLFKRFELPWEAGGVFLMLLGLQWYILFNVVAGAMAIPSDLKEAARVYRFSGWRKFRKFYLPCIFPYLVTGVVTAAGSAWNASIVTEYVTFKGQTLTIWGLGSQITDAAAKADFPMLTASVVVMSVVVVAFSRLVWDRLYRLAEERYSLSK